MEDQCSQAAEINHRGVCSSLCIVRKPEGEELMVPRVIQCQALYPAL